MATVTRVQRTYDHRLNDKLRAILGLLIAVFKVSGFSLANYRLPDNVQKARLLQAIDRSRRWLNAVRIAFGIVDGPAV